MTDTPQLTHEQVAEIAQEHESFLTQLEGLAIQAIANGNWWPVQDLISEVETWQAEQALLKAKEKPTDSINHLWAIAFPKASTDSLSRSGADSCSSANNQLEKD